ncbi:MAG: hypothetical protein ACLFSE_09310 [Spirochaetia bacterium]
MKILITQPKGKTKDIYFPEDILNRLGTMGTVIENPGDTKPAPEEFAEMIRGRFLCHPLESSEIRHCRSG